jgi:hypothetical protein
MVDTDRTAVGRERARRVRGLRSFVVGNSVVVERSG